MSYLRRAIIALVLAAGIGPVLAQVPPPVPALPDTERRTTYSITGTTCACAVNFALFGDSNDYQNWVEIYLNGVRVNFNDASFGWTITSPTGPLATIARPVTDAVLTFNSVQTGTVQIVGARRPRRTSQFFENRGVAARDINQTVTDITATLREMWDKNNDISGRVIQAPGGETMISLPAASTRAGGFLVFDGSGNPGIANATAGFGTVVGPTSSTTNDVACWNGTNGTVLKDCGTFGTTTLTGDITGGPSVGTIVTTLPTVNSNVGTFGGGANHVQITVNAKGQITAASSVTPALTSFTQIGGQIALSQLPTIANNSILANNSGVSAVPSALSASSILDMIGATQGQVLYRSASGWLALAPGTSGQLLSSNGAGANPSWITATGTGTVTSVTCGAGLSGGTFTTSGTCAQRAVTKQVLVAGSSGTYTTASGVQYIEIILVGGGGGGGAGTTGTSSNSGTAGGNTCWNTTGAACTTPVYQAGGGAGGAGVTASGSAIAAGGTVSGSGTCDWSVAGGSGNSGFGTTTAGAGVTSGSVGGMGGSSTLAGAGGGSYGNVVGGSAAANSGSGGGGGGAGSSASNGGGGGGAGATCHVVINSPAATYTYAVASSAAGGTGTTGATGGTGGGGQIIIYEH